MNCNRPRRVGSETMKRSGMASERAFYYESALELIAQSKAKVLMVQAADGSYLAGGLFYFNKDTVYFCKGASLKEGWPFCANNLLHWHLIRIARDAGHKRYNMVGADISANSPTAGITHFKCGFGGKLVPINVYTKTLSRRRKVTFSMARSVRSVYK